MGSGPSHPPTSLAGPAAHCHLSFTPKKPAPARRSRTWEAEQALRAQIPRLSHEASEHPWGPASWSPMATTLWWPRNRLTVGETLPALRGDVEETWRAGVQAGRLQTSDPSPVATRGRAGMGRRTPRPPELTSTWLLPPTPRAAALLCPLRGCSYSPAQRGRCERGTEAPQGKILGQQASTGDVRSERSVNGGNGVTGGRCSCVAGGMQAWSSARSHPAPAVAPGGVERDRPSEARRTRGEEGDLLGCPSRESLTAASPAGSGGRGSAVPHSKPRRESPRLGSLDAPDLPLAPANCHQYEKPLPRSPGPGIRAPPGAGQGLSCRPVSGGDRPGLATLEPQRLSSPCLSLHL